MRLLFCFIFVEENWGGGMFFLKNKYYLFFVIVWCGNDCYKIVLVYIENILIVFYKC